MRLNRHIADSGHCSRREADRLVSERRVTVNGLPAGIGTQVGEGDRVEVDGQPLATSPASHRASVMDGDLIEMLEQEVTAQWVQAISTARDVRYKACRNDYALTAGDIAAFGMVAAKLKSATHSSYRPGAGAPGKATTTEVGYEGMNWRPSSKASPFR